MKILRTLAFLLPVLALFCLCSCEKEDDLDTTPRVSCMAGEAGTAMKGEKIVVNATNISESTVVTVKFGREKILSRTGPGTLSYSFSQPGLKSIRVTTSPEEVQKKVWLVEVQALESLQSVAERLKNNKKLCLVMCHRANSSDFSIPENSLPAINKCIADKVDIVENDVQTTKDGVLVVSHDQNISRETDGSGNIKDLTLSQIKACNLRDRNGNVTGEKMLTFDEYLEACKGQIYVNVDIGDRDASVTAVVNAITRKGMIQQCLVYCSSVEKIAEAYKANPECNVYTSTNEEKCDAMLNGGLAGNNYFSQCDYSPTASTAKDRSEGNRTSPTEVASAAAKGAITTVNAIYTVDTGRLYPDRFPVDQMNELFNFYPSCQCVHVDTGAEARASLLAIGRQLLNN